MNMLKSLLLPAAVLGILGGAWAGQDQGVASAQAVAAATEEEAADSNEGSTAQNEEAEPEAAESEEGGGQEAESEEASEESESEVSEREECHMQLMPFRAEDETGMTRDSAILVDGCTGESMMLRHGPWKNSQTGETDKMYYWVRIPRADPERYQDEATAP